MDPVLLMNLVVIAGCLLALAIAMAYNTRQFKKSLQRVQTKEFWR